MQWPYPNRDTDPWFDIFESMVSGMDSSAYAAREDRNILISGGGNVSFVAATGVLSWSGTIYIFSPVSGFKFSMAPGSVTLSNGGYFYTSIVRSPQNNSSVLSYSAAQIPSSDSALALAVRDGNSVYFRNGSRIVSGETRYLFDGFSAKHIETVKLATRASHNSTSYIAVGADSFNAADYDKPGYSKTMIFRAVAANGAIGLVNDVTLYNVTDSDTVASLSFTSTSLAKDEVVLVEGAGIGEVDSVEKIYEVRISLGAPPAGPSDTIELFGAEIVVISNPIGAVLPS